MKTKRLAARRGFTIRDLAVGLTCLLVGASLLLSVTGASRNLSQAQVCANNLRQLYAGMVSYVTQYGFYPPHNPYPPYMAPRGDMMSISWDPNIGFIMAHGLGLVPPSTDTATGHFIWYTATFEELPDVCKCPAMPPELLDPANPELDTTLPLETLVFRYALSYQSAGTTRSATPVKQFPTGSTPGLGGRNPAIPDPTGGTITGRQMDNANRGYPYVWVMQKTPGSDPSDPDAYTDEYNCWIQAIHPAEVQQPSRVYYLADSRDYRPIPPGQSMSWPPAGKNDGWLNGWGNKIFLGTRHFEYANVLYLDGRVSRGNQTHEPRWNMQYDPVGNGQSVHWRCATFATDLRLASIHTQVHIMPVLMVKGWEYFFETSGVVAR